MNDVVLIDAGGANLGSVRYAFERLGARVSTSADPAVIRAASRVVLPGVGAAAGGMARLRELGLVEVVRGLSQPLLGICLGMQLLYDSSEEGDVECLGLLPGRVSRLVPVDGGFRYEGEVAEWKGSVQQGAIEHAWTLIPAQAYVAQMVQSLVEFPPSQTPASFTISQVMDKLKAGLTSA